MAPGHPHSGTLTLHVETETVTAKTNGVLQNPQLDATLEKLGQQVAALAETIQNSAAAIKAEG